MLGCNSQDPAQDVCLDPVWMLCRTHKSQPHPAFPGSMPAWKNKCDRQVLQALPRGPSNEYDEGINAHLTRTCCLIMRGIPLCASSEFFFTSSDILTYTRVQLWCGHPVQEPDGCDYRYAGPASPSRPAYCGQLLN